MVLVTLGKACLVHYICALAGPPVHPRLPRARPGLGTVPAEPELLRACRTSSQRRRGLGLLSSSSLEGL